MNTTKAKDTSTQGLGQIFPITSVDLDIARLRAVFKKKFQREIDWFFLICLATQRDLNPQQITLDNIPEAMSSSIQSDEKLDKELRSLIELTCRTWAGFMERRLDAEANSADDDGRRFVECLLRLFQMRLEPVRPKGLESKSKNDPYRFLIKDRLEKIELDLKGVLLDVRKEPWVPLGVLDAIEKSDFLLRAAQKYWIEVLSLHDRKNEAEINLFNEFVRLIGNEELVAKLFDAVLFEFSSRGLSLTDDADKWRGRVGYLS